MLATMMYLRDEGYPLPSGAILMSPWVDLTMCVPVFGCLASQS